MRVRSSPTTLSASAAAYVRMSTEHQQYSTENQLVAIRKYATDRGITIVRVYEDAGISGLRLSGREALQQLLADVQNNSADFDTILVYDVSRWGRFQDPDESAHYEYLCKLHHIKVQYCAEGFANDDTPTASIIKSVKRAMAGEYSRDLSTKVFAGQCRLIQLGFRQGGTAGYGLRRLLQDHQGNPKGTLGAGEHKSIQTDRVILIPGPSEEVATVHRIYDLFINHRQNEEAIARLLNAEGITTDLRRNWTRATVHQILTNPKYQGENVYNRVSFKLKQHRVRNPPSIWVRHEHAFTPIIETRTFAQAQEIINSRHEHLTDDELLDRLRALLQARGTLSTIIIDETPDMPSASTYRARFHSLVRAYTLIGYNPSHDYDYVATNRRLREHHAAMITDMEAELRSHATTVRTERDYLCINDEFTVGLTISRCTTTSAGGLRWTIRLDVPILPDITIATRMAPGNEEPLDYYLLPSIDMTLPRLRLREENRISMDVYRFDTLQYFYHLAARTRIPEAA
jgi:DNA invertase Pin-like site-specific DNA recombinase